MNCNSDYLLTAEKIEISDMFSKYCSNIAMRYDINVDVLITSSKFKQ